MFEAALRELWRAWLRIEYGAAEGRAGPPSTTTLVARGVTVAASLLVSSLFLVGRVWRLSKG